MAQLKYEGVTTPTFAGMPDILALGQRIFGNAGDAAKNALTEYKDLQKNRALADVYRKLASAKTMDDVRNITTNPSLFANPLFTGEDIVSASEYSDNRFNAADAMRKYQSNQSATKSLHDIGALKDEAKIQGLLNGLDPNNLTLEDMVTLQDQGRTQHTHLYGINSKNAEIQAQNNIAKAIREGRLTPEEAKLHGNRYISDLAMQKSFTPEAEAEIQRQVNKIIADQKEYQALHHYSDEEMLRLFNPENIKQYPLAVQKRYLESLAGKDWGIKDPTNATVPILNPNKMKTEDIQVYEKAKQQEDAALNGVSITPSSVLEAQKRLAQDVKYAGTRKKLTRLQRDRRIRDLNIIHQWEQNSSNPPQILDEVNSLISSVESINSDKALRIRSNEDLASFTDLVNYANPTKAKEILTNIFSNPNIKTNDDIARALIQYIPAEYLSHSSDKRMRAYASARANAEKTKLAEEAKLASKTSNEFYTQEVNKPTFISSSISPSIDNLPQIQKALRIKANNVNNVVNSLKRNLPIAGMATPESQKKLGDLQLVLTGSSKGSEESQSEINTARQLISDAGGNPEDVDRFIALLPYDKNFIEAWWDENKIGLDTKKLISILKKKYPVAGDSTRINWRAFDNDLSERERSLGLKTEEQQKLSKAEQLTKEANEYAKKYKLTGNEDYAKLAQASFNRAMEIQSNFF